MTLKLKKAHKDVLLSLHKNLTADPKHLFFKPDAPAVVELTTATPPLLYGNPALKNDKGEMAFILSPDGETEAGNLATKAETPAAPRVAVPASAIMSMEVEGWTPPEKGRGGRQGSVYPFDTTELGQNGKTNGFFVAVTTERPEPWKTLIGTVNAYNKKMKDKAQPGETPRQFSKPEQRRHPSGVEGAFIARIS